MPMTDDWTKDAVSHERFIEIQRFLNLEAALLDRREFRPWLALFTEDLSYRVTAQITRDGAAGNIEYAIIDEDAAGLRARVEQISNPRLTRAENPPSLTRRFVSNLRAAHGESPDEFLVEANLLVYRSKAALPEGAFYVGERLDRLRQLGTELRLARRHVRLDHATLYGGAVSILF